MYGSQWGSLAAACSLLQVMQESVSGTTSHMYASECAMKLKVKSLSPWYQAIPENNITRLLPLTMLLMLHTPSNALRQQQTRDIALD